MQCPECEGYCMTEVNGTEHCLKCKGKGRIPSDRLKKAINYLKWQAKK